jgi:hypothetical protein
MQRTLIIICVAGLSAKTAQLLEKQLDNMTTCRASLMRWCLNMKAASTTLNLGLHCPPRVFIISAFPYLMAILETCNYLVSDDFLAMYS